MDESDFEGSLVLEKLAEIGKIDDFFEALELCGDIFDAGDMTVKEAVYILQAVAKKMPLDTEDTEPRPSN